VLILVKKIKYFLLADFLEFTDNIGIIPRKYSKMSHWYQQLHKEHGIIAHKYFYVLCLCQLWQAILALPDINILRVIFFLSCHMDTWRYQTCVFVSVTFMWAVTKEAYAFFHIIPCRCHIFHSWQILYASLSCGLNKLLVKCYTSRCAMIQLLRK
jgi:hypothetical protein